MKYDPLELAWAAGFFDGEGSLYLNHSRPGYAYLRLTVDQSDIRPILRFCCAVKNGIIYGPYQYTGQTKPFYRVHVGKTKQVFQVIGCLWGYLSEPKREQVTRIIAEYRTLCNRRLQNVPS